MLGRGIGYNAMVLSVSAAVGPTLAALILSVASWQWLFLINLPIGIAALIVGRKALPDPHGHGKPFDWPSALLSAAMMGLIVFGAETFAREGSGFGAAMIAGGLIAGAALVWRDWRKPAPLMPLDLLRIPIFSLSILTSIVSFAAQMLAYVAIPFLFQSVLGRSVFATGLLMTPWPLAVGVAAPFAGRLADRVNAGLLGGIGLAIFAAGLFLPLAARCRSEQSRHRLEDGGVRPWLRLLPVAQQPHDRQLGARSRARAQPAACSRRRGCSARRRAPWRSASPSTLRGVHVTPTLLFVASIAALAAAGISLLRLNVAPPGRVAVYKPILD